MIIKFSNGITVNKIWLSNKLQKQLLLKIGTENMMFRLHTM